LTGLVFVQFFTRTRALVRASFISALLSSVSNSFDSMSVYISGYTAVNDYLMTLSIVSPQIKYIRDMLFVATHASHCRLHARILSPPRSRYPLRTVCHSLHRHAVNSVDGLGWVFGLFGLMKSMDSGIDSTVRSCEKLSASPAWSFSMASTGSEIKFAGDLFLGFCLAIVSLVRSGGSIAIISEIPQSSRLRSLTLSRRGSTRLKTASRIRFDCVGSDLRASSASKTCP
jgi:hypothetical protein